MADKRITDLSELTAPVDGDVFCSVDVSDTTDSSAGTTKKTLWSTIKSTLKTYFDTLYPTEVSWTTWNPTFTNFTKGSAAIIAYYKQIGKTVHYSLQISYAADSSMGTNPTFTLPVAAKSIGYGTDTSQIGQITIIDQGVAFFTGAVLFASTTTGGMYVNNASASYAALNGLGATVPMTWAATDFISITGVYEAA